MIPVPQKTLKNHFLCVLCVLCVPFFEFWAAKTMARLPNRLRIGKWARASSLERIRQVVSNRCFHSTERTDENVTAFPGRGKKYLRPGVVVRYSSLHEMDVLYPDAIGIDSKRGEEPRDASFCFQYPQTRTAREDVRPPDGASRGQCVCQFNQPRELQLILEWRKCA